MENSNRVTAADLSGGDRSLMTTEELLFQEVLKGSLTIQVTRICIALSVGSNALRCCCASTGN